MLCSALILAMLPKAKTPHAPLAKARLPLSADQMVFVPNNGQWNSDVRFCGKGKGVTLWVTSRGLTYDFFRAKGKAKRHVVKVSFSGSAGTPLAVALDRQPGELNYLIGRDSSKWATHVPIYGAVKLSNLYKGIDLVAYFDRTREMPRYDMVVHPGADPRQIAMRYDGAQNLHLTHRGTVAYGTCLGEIQEQDLVAYEGVEQLQRHGQRKTVACAQILRGNGEVAFSVGRHDRNKQLVLDPLVWSTYLGGDQGSDVAGIATGPGGTVYVAGDTRSTNFPTTAGVYQPNDPAAGGFFANDCVFLVRMNGTTSKLNFGTYIGGTGSQNAGGLAVDKGGNATIVGHTSSSDFPTTAPAAQTSLPGSDSAFAVRISPNGTTLKFGTYLGGSGMDRALGVAVDAAGNSYVTGSSGSSNFPTTAGAFQTGNAATGGIAPFVAKLDSLGAEVYGTYLAGTDFAQTSGIAVDANGCAYVSGAVYGPGFPVTAGAAQTSFGGFLDAFVAKLSADGSSEVYSTFLGGEDNDQAHAIAIDAAGAAYVTGSTFSSGFPLSGGAYQTVHSGSGAWPYVTKVAPDGKSFDYSTFVGNTGTGNGIALDAFGQAFVVGSSVATDFPTTNGAIQSTNSSDACPVIFGLNTTGTQLLYSTYLGGSRSDFGKVITLDASGMVYIAGTSSSPDFPTTPKSLQPFHKSHFGMEGFVAKINPVSGFTLTLSKGTVPGGNTVTGTITLPAPAPGGGFGLSLTSSSNLAKLSTSTVTIPAANTIGTFTIATSGVDDSTPVQITASDGTNLAERTLVLIPPSVDTINVAPVSVWGGSSTAVKGTFTLNGKVGPSGLSVSFFSSDPTAVMPNNPAPLQPNATGGSFTIDHAWVPSDRTVFIFANPSNGGIGQLNVKAILPASVNVPSTIVGGTTVSGMVNLNHAAPLGGLPLTIICSDNGQITWSGSVPQNQMSENFQISTSPVAFNQTVTVTAMKGTTSVSKTVTIVPYKIASIVPNVSSVPHGGDSTAVTVTVTLNGVAPTGGLPISLVSSQPAVANPVGPFVIPQGSNSQTFTIQHFPVSSIKSVKFTASVNGVSKSCTITVNP